MNPKRRARGFTLTEMLVVIAIIGILAALLLPAVSRSQMRAKRIWCINNLQQLGVGFQMFAHDHDSKFPMQVPIANGGSEEFVQAGYNSGAQFYFSHRHFQALSNEISEPKILVCPADTRQPAQSISVLQNSNVSYFVAVSADYNKPISILAGDRNVAAGSQATILNGDANNPLRWTSEMHQFKGNILFADSHVEEWNNANWQANGNGFGNGQTTIILPTASGQSGNSGGSGNYSSGGNSGWRPPLNGSPPSQPKLPSPSPQKTSPQNSMTADHQFSDAGILSERVELALTNKAGTNVMTTNSSPPSATETNEDVAMSDFDRHIVKTARSLFAWFYLLLLLLLLLWLLFRFLNRKNHRRPSNGDSEHPDRPT